MSRWTSLFAELGVRRFIFIGVVLVGAALALGRAHTESRMERRRNVFQRVAELVNGPLGEIKPFHERLGSSSGTDVLLVDGVREACREAAAPIEKLEGLSFPPDEQGKVIESGESVKRAASRFRRGVADCWGTADAGTAGSGANPTCTLQCMRNWSSLANAVERLWYDGNWVGVRIERIAPAPKKDP